MVNLYGIIYALGFLTIFLIFKFYFKNKHKDLEYLATIYLILGIVIGARLLYVIYYYPLFYFSNPLEILYVWKGGLSFHGGLIGGVIGMAIFCRKNNLNLLEIGDLVSIPAVIFLALGRLANFYNSELYGKITHVPWCVNFKNVDGCRHPVQIYGAIKNFVVFFILIYLKDKKLKRGMLFFSFLLLYSTSRFFLDFYRDYQQTILGLGSGQILNIITILVSSYFILRISIKQN